MSSGPEGDEAAATGGGDLPRRRGGGGVPHRCDVLLLGASFAGVEVLLQLQRRLPRPLKILVVDRQERHGYIPLVHERLTGRLPPEATELPTAAFVGSLPGVRFVQGEVIALDPKAKRVELRSGQRIEARFVVVALGSELAPPPGLPGGEHLLRYKLEGEVEHARERLAEVLGDGAGEARPRLVVVGGGISGVELAAELAHLGTVRPEGWRSPVVTLVSASTRLLPELAPGVGRKAGASLKAQGVDVRLRTRVAAVEADAVRLASLASAEIDTAPLSAEELARAPHRAQLPGEERLGCAAAFWAGGIRPAPALELLGLPRTPEGWLAVGPTLQCFPTAVPSQPDVFACGDAVRVIGGQGQWPTMQRAIECLWQAKVVAKNLVTLAEHAPEYPQGVPPLLPHVLRETFPYGVSLGGRSLVVYGGARVDVPGVNVWFRRWLMRQYFARYAPRG
jgi:NADH:ubiquinone reductase (H+-translocating)